MPSCAVCGKLTPAGRVVRGVGIVCPARRETDCLEVAQDRKWRAEPPAIEVER
jgi:hypothetical protein